MLIKYQSASDVVKTSVHLYQSFMYCRIYFTKDGDLSRSESAMANRFWQCDLDTPAGTSGVSTKDDAGLSKGRDISNDVPFPKSLEIDIVPPMPFIRSETMLRPSPNPSLLLLSCEKIVVTLLCLRAERVFPRAY